MRWMTPRFSIKVMTRIGSLDWGPPADRPRRVCGSAAPKRLSRATRSDQVFDIQRKGEAVALVRHRRLNLRPVPGRHDGDDAEVELVNHGLQFRADARRHAEGLVDVDADEGLPVLDLADPR